LLAFVLLHNLFQNILNRQADSQKADAIVVHQQEEVAAGSVDAGDALEIHRDFP
jgi:hypothetical protein